LLSVHASKKETIYKNHKLFFFLVAKTKLLKAFCWF